MATTMERGVGKDASLDGGVRKKWFKVLYYYSVGLSAGTKPEKIIGGAGQNCYIDLTLL